MYATLVKMRYAWTAIAFAVIFTAIGIWYTQPVDIYGLDSVLKVETISVSVTQAVNDKNETRSVSFAQGEDSFDTVLERVEAMEFRRPFKNLILPSLKKEDLSVDRLLEDGEYCIRVELSGPDDRALTVVCDTDKWEYRKSVYDDDLPLKVTEKTESPKVLSDYFWELAAETAS